MKNLYEAKMVVIDKVISFVVINRNTKAVQSSWTTANKAREAAESLNKWSKK